MSSSIVDMMGRVLNCSHPPKRIISIVPSQTELLYDLGLNEEIIGITKFCCHPRHWKREKAIIGGTKKLNHEKIKALQPDLIIGNKEENLQLDIELLEKNYPVWMSDIYTLEDAYKMISSLGFILEKGQQSEDLIKQIAHNFNGINVETVRNKKVLYFIWRNPWMAAGKNTFIDHILSVCGFENILASNRYPSISNSELEQLNPDLILLSSEPYPFKDLHIEELKTIFPSAQIRLCDGEMFSWYGSRLLHAPAYFNELITETQ